MNALIHFEFIHAIYFFAKLIFIFFNVELCHRKYLKRKVETYSSNNIDDIYRFVVFYNNFFPDIQYSSYQIFININTYMYIK